MRHLRFYETFDFNEKSLYFSQILKINMLPTKQKSVYLLTKKSKKAFCKKRNFL